MPATLIVNLKGTNMKTMNTQGMSSSDITKSPFARPTPKPPYLVWRLNPDGTKAFVEVHRGDQCRYEMERDNYASLVSDPL
jgi:hypothetical protein